MLTERERWEARKHFTNEEFPPPEPTFQASEFDMSFDSCPHGSVPVIETRRAPVERAGSPEKFARKRHPSVFPNNNCTFCDKKPRLPLAIPLQKPQHKFVERAVAGTGTLNGPNDRRLIFGGTSGYLSSWQPFVRMDRNEESVAQVWLGKRRDTSGFGISTVEVGWRVAPESDHYFSLLPRFFVYWTRDDYQTSGCYNLHCTGFVNAGGSVPVLLGQELDVSSIDGDKVEYFIQIMKGSYNGGLAWHLMVNNKEVGYFVADDTWKVRRSEANFVMWGGEVGWDPTSDRQLHTETQMGNGIWNPSNYAAAAYVRKIKIYDMDLSERANARISWITDITNWPCYNAHVNFAYSGLPLLGYGVNTNLFFGGSGYNRTNNCIYAYRNIFPF